jgi:major membrane immunogen (membrane-anchored lipoprotein)
MKKNGLITIMIALMTMVFGACEESELPSDAAIEGTYVGTVTNIDDTLNDRTYAKL